MAGFGGAVRLQGEAEYKKALKEITANLKEVSSEMKITTTAFDKNDRSTEAVKARTEALTKQLMAQNNALSILKTQYANLSSEQARNQANHQGLLNEYAQAQKELERIGTELGKDSDEYLNQAIVVADLAKAVEKSTATNEKNELTLSGMRTEMNNLQSSINSTEAEIKNDTKATDDLSKSTKDAGASAKSAGDGFTVFKGIIANLASQAITKAVDGLKSMGSAMVNIGKQALTNYADYEQLTGGIETLFGTGGKSLEEYAKSVGLSVEKAKKKYENLEKAQSLMLQNAQNAYKTAGVDANTYMENVTSFSASLIKSLRGDTLKATEYADKAMRDMSDNANKFGTDIQSIQNAYQGFAKGNYNMLDNLKLGYGGTKSEMMRLVKESGVLGKASKDLTLKNFDQKVSFDKMVEAIHKTQERMGITGTTAKEAEKTISGSVNGMKSAWSNLLTAIADDNANMEQSIDNFISSVLAVGENIIPRIKTIIDGIGKMISGLVDKLLPELLKQLPSILNQLLPVAMNTIQLLITSISSALPEILPVIQRVILDGLPVIISALQSAIQSILAVMPDLIRGFADLIPQICSTIMESLPELLQAGIDILKALIDGIEYALPQLLDMLPELIETVVGFVVDHLGEIIDAGIQLTMAITEGIMDALPKLLEKMPELIAKLIAEIIKNLPKIIEMGIRLTTSIITGIIKAMPQLIMMMPKIIKELITELKNNLPEIIEGGIKVVMALVDGIKARIDSAKQACAELMARIVDLLGELPSKMVKLGKELVNGIWQGISNALSTLKQNIKKMASGITDAVKKAFSIHSPSLLWKNEIGKNLALGLGEGFSDEMKNVSAMMEDSIPTSFDLQPSIATSAIQSSTASGMATANLIEAFKTAMQGMRIEMGEDGFASFVVDTITNEIYR